MVGLDRFLQHAFEIEPGLVVERGERLVQQQDVGVHDQGADQCHALAHAARKRFRIGVLETGEAEALQIFPRLAFGFGAVDAAGLQPKQDIAEHGAPGKQQVLLHHVADATAQAVDLLAAIDQRAVIGLDETRDDVEDGGLAAAATGR